MIRVKQDCHDWYVADAEEVRHSSAGVSQANWIEGQR